MIVDSMTAQEIHDELFADFRNILPTVEYRKEKFRSACLKARKYPFRQVYECKSLKRKNRFFVIFTAVRRGQYKDPFQGFYCVYDRPEGMYCAVLHPSESIHEPHLTCIYPPHYFARYRERAGIPGPVSSLDLIHHFMKHQWTISLMMFREMDNDELVKEVGEDGMPKEGGIAPYKGHIDWDGILETEDINMVMRDARGFILGARQEDTIICKTFVADDMVFEDQFPLFRSVNYLFYKHVFDQFGADGYKDILRYEGMPLHPFEQFYSEEPDTTTPAH